MNNSRYPAACTALLVLLIVACSKGDAPRADSGAARAGAAPLTVMAAAKQLPGALTKPIDSYTGDEFYAFVQGLSFTADSVKDRKCKNDPACGSAPKAKKIKVGVAAVVGQDSLSAGTTPQYGVVYIRATNKGDAEEARYSMKPGKHLEFYVVVLPDSGGTMKYRLEQLDTRAGSRQHTSIGTGPFIECPHRWAPGAKADFKTCASAAAAHDSVVKLGLLLQGGDEDPMWVSCSTGCCTVGST
ncbi:hypothetical protein BH09GEM1_BH09GEM1_30040 [soil metagenome]